MNTDCFGSAGNAKRSRLRVDRSRLPASRFRVSMSQPPSGCLRHCNKPSSRCRVNGSRNSPGKRSRVSRPSNCRVPWSWLAQKRVERLFTPGMARQCLVNSELAVPRADQRVC